MTSSTSGSVQFLDLDGNEIGVTSFTNIENLQVDAPVHGVVGSFENDVIYVGINDIIFVNGGAGYDSVNLDTDPGFDTTLEVFLNGITIVTSRREGFEWDFYNYNNDPEYQFLGSINSVEAIILSDGTYTLEDLLELQSQKGVVLNGDKSANELIGANGADTISGLGGDDTLKGGDGDDSLSGGAGDDLLGGGQGDDTLEGSATSFDIADYSKDYENGGNQGIIADLTSGTIEDGFGDTDTVVNIDEVQGTASNDIMFASDADASFMGFAGDDRLEGAAGNDFLSGGTGNNTLSGADGDDILIISHGNSVLDGGGGFDLLTIENSDGSAHDVSISYSESGAGLIEFSDGNYSTYQSQFSNIEIIAINIGFDRTATFEGSAGNDVISIYSLNMLLIDSGAGIDTLSFSFFDKSDVFGNTEEGLSVGQFFSVMDLRRSTTVVGAWDVINRDTNEIMGEVAGIELFRFSDGWFTLDGGRTMTAYLAVLVPTRFWVKRAMMLLKIYWAITQLMVAREMTSSL